MPAKWWKGRVKDWITAPGSGWRKTRLRELAVFFLVFLSFGMLFPAALFFTEKLLALPLTQELLSRIQKGRSHYQKSIDLMPKMRPPRDPNPNLESRPKAKINQDPPVSQALSLPMGKVMGSLLPLPEAPKINPASDIPDKAASRTQEFSPASEQADKELNQQGKPLNSQGPDFAKIKNVLSRNIGQMFLCLLIMIGLGKGVSHLLVLGEISDLLRLFNCLSLTAIYIWMWVLFIKIYEGASPLVSVICIGIIGLGGWLLIHGTRESFIWDSEETRRKGRRG